MEAEIYLFAAVSWTTLASSLAIFQWLSHGPYRRIKQWIYARVLSTVHIMESWVYTYIFPTSLSWRSAYVVAQHRTT